MRDYLNREQKISLSNFFMDLAKGLILGSIGFAAVVSFEAKLTGIIVGFFMAFLLVDSGLSLLKKNNNEYNAN